jgi:hypothetical protein
MSLYGAMRMAILGWSRPADPPDARPLTPIRPGAWAEWARASSPATAEVLEARTEWARAASFEHLVDGEPGETCLTTDGRSGRVVAVFDGSGWVRVCESA